MYRTSIAPTLLIAAGLIGCSEAPPTAAVAEKAPAASRSKAVGDDTPEAVTTAFLKAIFAGDSQTAGGLLTAAAAGRHATEPEMLDSLGMQLATLEVSESRLLSEAEAAVVCSATPADGEPQEVCCLLKRDARGWGVCGMASDPSGSDPVIISFEPEAAPVQLVGDESPNDTARTAVRPETPLR